MRIAGAEVTTFLRMVFFSRFTTHCLIHVAVAAWFALASSACRSNPWPPGVQDVPDASPVLSPDDALETFYLPPGFEIELVASEPTIEDPVDIDFDADGRMYVVEMRAYMPNVEGTGERVPRGRVSVLEDVDGDGRMDRSTVFLDSLVLPRAVKVLDDGVLVGEPPYLWLARDTTGDLRADVKEAVRDDYGRRPSNPERNPNGLAWGLDNWILNVWWDKRIRVDADGEWTEASTPDVGQWGVSIDDYGYVYRNSNEDPLRVELVPAYYYARNPNLERMAGAYYDVVESDSVWPVRPTEGINRGYREHMLRGDGTLATFTAAGSPVVYRGDRLPQDLLNDVFITEPSGNLVRRFEIAHNPDGSIAATNPYADVRGEFLASTDERFRPVNLFSGPDGTLYVVDFYRGIVQHRDYLTEYLQEHIERRGLDEPIGLGRIYRITHEDFEPDYLPHLSSTPASELVELLQHPNGWWRDTAQRLLVLRGDTSAASQLRTLALSADDERVRLHALWTLSGLEIERTAALAALGDPSPYVRSAAVRLLEGRPELLDALEDSSRIVRRQLAASAGSLPGQTALEAVATLMVRDAADAVLIDAGLSGLSGREAVLLSNLLDRSGPAALADAIEMTTAAALHAGARTEIFAAAGDERRPAWQREAILEGILEFAPAPPRSEDRWADFEPLELETVPADLMAAAESGPVASAAQEALERFSWPGKPTPERSEVRPLTTSEQVLFDRGAELFALSCATCHGEEGTGLEGVAPALRGSPWLNGDEDAVIRILLHGKEGERLMPPQRSLSDEEIASVLTYVRRAWTNRGTTIDPDEVAETRGRTASRDRPWTEEELAD